MTDASQQSAQQVPDDVERVARAICEAGGRDPDQLTYHTIEPGVQEPYGPAWSRYEPEARAALAAIPQPDNEVERLREALQQAADAMTCRNDDDAHYCPNCDNSLYEARAKARTALATKKEG